jgi:DNA ligase-4
MRSIHLPRWRRQRRGGAISHFLLGVQAPSYERHRHGETEHPRFYPFCKVGSGYTHQQLHSLRDDLKRGQHSWHKHSRPAHLCGWTPNKTDDEPDVWFEPSKSKVMAVAAYEIVKGGPNAPFLPCGYTLRFPRCSCIRHDKQWDDTVTHEEVLARFNDGKAKIAASKRTAADVAAANPDDLQFGGAGGKRGKRAGGAGGGGPGGGGPGGGARAVAVLPHMRLNSAALKEAAAAKESELFRDHIVVVRGFGSNDASHPRFPANLQSLVARHGGTVHANVTPETTLLVSADDPPGVLVNGDVARARTERWGHCDVVTSSYLLESVERGALIDPEPRFTLYAKPFTRDVIAARMDQWGDRYDEPATMEGLRRAMALVRRDACASRPRSLPAAAAAGAAAAGGAAPSYRALVAAGPAALTGSGPSSSSSSSASGVGAAALDAASRADEHSACEMLGQLPDADVARLRSGPASCLLGLVAYAPRIATRLRLRIAGARTVDTPCASVTHAVLPTGSVGDGTCAAVRAALSQSRVEAYEAGGSAGVSPWLVSEAWLDACEEAGAHVEERPHALQEARHAAPA